MKEEELSAQVLACLDRSSPSEIAQAITEAQTYQQISAIFHHIESNQQAQLSKEVTRELQNMLVVHPEHIYSSAHFLSAHRLLLIRHLFLHHPNIEPSYFQNESAFVLMAVASGFLMQKLSVERMTKLKQYFGKNLKKQMNFWGLSSLQSLQNYLSNSSTGYFPYHNQAQHDLQLDRFQFFLQFFQNNSPFFPPSVDIWSIIFKLMLCLKEEKPRDKVLFQKMKAMYFNDRYHLQTTLKNMKFALQFFKNPFAQKECLYNPPKPINSILQKYSPEQLQSLLQNSSMGLTWDTPSVYNFFVSCIKLGITEATCKLMVAMIGYCQKRQKFNELIYNFENNFEKLFIFLKYPQLFVVTSKMLRYFLYSAPPQISLYQKFVEKAVPLASSISKDILYPYLNILQTVACLYKDTTNVLDLNAVIEAHIAESYCRLTEEEMRQQIAQYSWKGKVKVKAQGRVLQKQSGYKGLTNIGNSCYMNSFLQALFMNREFTNGVLTVSTLQLERERLKQAQERGHQDHVALSKQTREEMRPLAELQRLFALLLHSRRPEVSPLPIRNVSPPQFKNNYQHDAIEFGRLFLDSLYKNKMGKIFEGEMTTAIECEGCKQTRERREVFLDLIVTPQKQEETLEQTIGSAFREETMHDLVCDFCSEKKENSVKRHFLSKFPNYLIVSIKRFEYCVAEQRNRKIMAKVVVKPAIRLHQEDYHLYSLIIHRGPSPNAGHYFAFSKHSYEPDSHWICHNDSEVTQLDSYKEVTDFLDNNESDTPYILFFQRKQHVAAAKDDLMKPVLLRKALEEYVQRDFLDHQKAKEKKVLPLFNPLNFPSFFKKDDDEDEGDQNRPFYNHYIL